MSRHTQHQRLAPPRGNQRFIRCNTLRAIYYGQRTTPTLLTGPRFAFSLPHGYEEAASVLRISRLSQEEGALTIKLEGELLRPWVGCVRDACAIRDVQPRRLRLDLAAVTHV